MIAVYVGSALATDLTPCCMHACTLSLIYSTHLYIWRICCKEGCIILSLNIKSAWNIFHVCVLILKKKKKIFFFFFELRFFRSQRYSHISLCNTLALLDCGCSLYWWSRAVVQQGAVCQEVYQQIKKIYHTFFYFRTYTSSRKQEYFILRTKPFS